MEEFEVGMNSDVRQHVGTPCRLGGKEGKTIRKDDFSHMDLGDD